MEVTVLLQEQPRKNGFVALSSLAFCAAVVTPPVWGWVFLNAYFTFPSMLGSWFYLKLHPVVVIPSYHSHLIWSSKCKQQAGDLVCSLFTLCSFYHCTATI